MLASGAKPDLSSQIIVVDNASVDGTLAKLNRWGKNIQIVWNKANKGFAPAHNQAIQLSNCDYCLVLNPDVILHPDYVYSLIEYAKKTTVIGSLTGKLLFKSDTEIMDSANHKQSSTRI